MYETAEYVIRTRRKWVELYGANRNALATAAKTSTIS